MPTTSPTLQATSAAAPRVYYGWAVLLVAAAAMLGTLPGRTQGLGLITEPLLADLRLGRVDYAALNFWATIVGSAGAVGIGHVVDRLGSRLVLTLVSLSLGLVVCAMSQTSSFIGLAVWITLTRALGQSALSVVSLTMVGQWFVRKIDTAMATFSLVMSIGFMMAFPVVGSLVQQWGWRAAWLTIGISLIAGLAPLGWAVVRRGPEVCGLLPDGEAAGSVADRQAIETAASAADGYSLTAALLTPAFWVFATGTALYGLVASGIGLFNESILAERGFGADVYYQTLVVTAMTALAGNFLGGWLAMTRPARTAHGGLAIRADDGSGRTAARGHGRSGDGVGDRHGARRRPRHGAVLQRLASIVRPPASRAHPGRGSGAYGRRVSARTVAAGVVRRVDRQLRRDVPDPCRDHRRRLRRGARRALAAVTANDRAYVVSAFRLHELDRPKTRPQRPNRVRLWAPGFVCLVIAVAIAAPCAQQPAVVSVERIRAALAKPPSRLTLTERPPDFVVHIEERQPLQNVFDLPPWAELTPFFGGVSARPDPFAPIEGVPHRVVPPAGSIYTLGAARSLPDSVRALRKSVLAPSARREAQRTLADYCAAQPNYGAAIQVCSTLPPVR